MHDCSIRYFVCPFSKSVVYPCDIVAGWVLLRLRVASGRGHIPDFVVVSNAVAKSLAEIFERAWKKVSAESTFVMILAQSFSFTKHLMRDWIFR